MMGRFTEILKAHRAGMSVAEFKKQIREILKAHGADMSVAEFKKQKQAP